jgi:hypothetical protein
MWHDVQIAPDANAEKRPRLLERPYSTITQSLCRGLARRTFRMTAITETYDSPGRLIVFTTTVP